MDYSKMTVPELRKLCGKRGLPKYQRNKVRLRKADLVAQLAGTPKVSRRARKVNPEGIVTDEARILEVMRGMSCSHEDNKAMNRIRIGRDQEADRRRWLGRRLKAIQHLRDRSATDSEWRGWCHVYQKTAGVVV